MQLASRSSSTWSASHADVLILERRVTNLQLELDRRVTCLERKLDRFMLQDSLRWHEEERRRADTRVNLMLYAMVAMNFLVAATVWTTVLIEGM